MNEQARRTILALTQRSESVATAESLTGGLLGATLSGVPGASRCFLGGVISYDTSMKVALLGVPRETIARNSVISAEVAQAMARGIVERTGADWGIAVTGVAGPDPQDGHAPGEVWVCVHGPRTTSASGMARAERFDFAGDRDSVRLATVEASLQKLLGLLFDV